MKRYLKITISTKERLNVRKENLNARKEKSSKRWAALIMAISFTLLFLLYFWFHKQYGVKTWIKFDWHILDIWSDKGLSLAVCFASIALAIPNISFKSEKIRKKFAERNNKTTKILTVLSLLVSFIAALVKPCIEVLQKKCKPDENKFEYWGMNIFGILLFLFLIFLFYAFIVTLGEIYKFHEMDLQCEKEEKSFEIIAGYRISDTTGCHTQIKTIHSISTMRKVQDTPSQEEN